MCGDSIVICGYDSEFENVFDDHSPFMDEVWYEASKFSSIEPLVCTEPELKAFLTYVNEAHSPVIDVVFCGDNPPYCVRDTRCTTVEDIYNYSLTTDNIRLTLESLKIMNEVQKK